MRAGNPHSVAVCEWHGPMNADFVRMVERTMSHFHAERDTVGKRRTRTLAA